MTESLKWLKSWLKSGEKSKTQFDKLSNEMVLLILDQLDFPDLLLIAEMDDRLATLACDVFRRKNFTVEFDSLSMYSRISPAVGLLYLSGILDASQNRTLIPYRIQPSVIVIHDMDFAVKFMKLFGWGIQKIKINYRANIPIIWDASRKYMLRSNIEEIGKMINEYCDETLLSIEFHDVYYNALKYMPKPFQRVTHVEFTGRVPQDKKQNLSMNELFPALHHLSLRNMPGINNYLVDTFPNLEQLSLDIADGNEAIMRLIALNPQIRNAELGNITSQYLDALLPQLDSLAVVNLNNVNSIHFENITTFEVMDYNMAPNQITFSNLQTLKMGFKWNAESMDGWIVFLQNHPNISRFEMNYVDLMTFVDIKPLLTQLPNIREMYIDSFEAQRLDDDVIANFIQNHEHLTKVVLTSYNHYQDEMFQQKLNGSAWAVTVQDQEMLFQRQLL